MQFDTRLKFVVGVGLNRSGQPINPASVLHLKRVAVQIILRHGFGGVSVYEHQGAWIDGAGNLIEEQGLTFEVLCKWEQPYSLGEAGQYRNAYPTKDKEASIRNELRGLFDQEAVISSSEVISATLS